MKWQDDPVTARLVALYADPALPVSARVTLALLTRITVGVAFYCLKQTPQGIEPLAKLLRDTDRKLPVGILVHSLEQLQEWILSSADETLRKELMTKDKTP